MKHELGTETCQESKGYAHHMEQDISITLSEEEVTFSALGTDIKIIPEK